MVFFQGFRDYDTDTSEGTAFKENAGTDTVTVVYAELLYVEYDSLHLMLTNF